MVNGLSSNLNNLHAVNRNNQILNEKINSEIEVEEKERQREKRFDSFELQEKEKVAGIYDVKKMSREIYKLYLKDQMILT